MKLNISAKTPDWWELNERSTYKTISEWWNGIEWVQYETPNFGDKCVNMNMAQEVVCYADIGAHAFAETFQIEWAYKIINHSVDKVLGGLQTEYHNFVEMISCFPC